MKHEITQHVAFMIYEEEDLDRRTFYPRATPELRPGGTD